MNEYELTFQLKTSDTAGESIEYGRSYKLDGKDPNLQDLVKTIFKIASNRAVQKIKELQIQTQESK